MKVLFIVPYPIGKAPSQRFRFEQYFKILEGRNIKYETHSFLTSQNWQLFSDSGRAIAKLFALFQGFMRRTLLMFRLGSYDLVFIHREAAPVGPPVYEWVISKIWRKRVIYDFDDAIWMTDKISESNVARWIKWRSKVATTCKWSYRVSCGNEYLASYARQYNSSVIVNPTTIDLTYHMTRSSKRSEGLVLGWTGSYSTLKYLARLEPVLQQILSEYPHVNVTVIADRAPNLNLARLSFVQWDQQTEIDDLQKFDIGVMPLPDDDWSKGKCGFKLLQYFALGIPAIADAVGANNQIIINGASGYLCRSSVDWLNGLRRLISDQKLRNSFGETGRKMVEARYSVEANSSNFLSLLE